MNRRWVLIRSVVLSLTCTVAASSQVAAQDQYYAPPASGYVAQPAPGFSLQQQPIYQPAPPAMQQGVVPANTGDSDPTPQQVVNMPGVTTALKIIHHRSQTIKYRSNIVRTQIADPTILDVIPFGPDELSLVALSVGTTTITLWFEGEEQPLVYLIDVIRDPSLEERTRFDYGRLEEKIRVLFPNSKVYLIPISGKIVVKGQAYDIEESHQILQLVYGEVINQNGFLGGPQVPYAAWVDQSAFLGPNNLASNQVINMLRVPGEFQVTVKVTIAELQRAGLRRMGVDIAGVINGRVAIGSLLSGAAGAGAAGAAAGGTSAAAISAASATGATLTGLYNSGQIFTLINFLQAQGYAKLLAESQLTVESGHSASFLSGGEFAVPTIIGVGGAAGQQTSFRGFGTSIIVTPTVIDKDLIRMNILPEFSEVNNSNRVQGIPGLNSRRVQTTTTMREGQTIALGGSFSNRETTETAWIPFLGEIPFIGGTIFTSKRANKDQSELLILVTPELIRPLDPDEVPPVPGYHVTHPNNHELFIHGMNEGAPDRRVHQLPPYGHGAGRGIEIGHTQFEPTPSTPVYRPLPTNPYGAGAPAFGPMPATGVPMPATGGYSSNPAMQPRTAQQAPMMQQPIRTSQAPAQRTGGLSAFRRPFSGSPAGTRNPVQPAGWNQPQR